MVRAFLCCSTLIIIGLPSRADLAAPASETLIRLNLTPAVEPKPALRYVLLPRMEEMNPGNPVACYLRAVLDHQEFFFDEDVLQRRDGLLAMPLKHLSADESRDYGARALNQLDAAARLDKPDWQVLTKLKVDGFQLLLPDVQEMRGLARALVVRLRIEISQGRFDAATRTMQTLFAMARHLGAHPTFIGNLVGIAIASMTITPFEEMLEQPGCPSYYWALTTLPHPLVPFDQALLGERALGTVEFQALSDSAPMTPDQIQQFATRWDSTFGGGNKPDPGNGVRAWLDARNHDATYLSAARRRLVESGVAEERLRQFPVDQVLLLDAKRECVIRYDDFLKTLGLPLWQAEPLRARNKAIASPSPTPALFVDQVIPAVEAFHRAQTRIEQRLALLRQVEALRLYAAEHCGACPRRLADVSVPLPIDPVTGQPFRYTLDGQTVHLRGTAPAGEETNRFLNVHYELTLQP